jgi:hypothetical protein
MQKHMSPTKKKSKTKTQTQTLDGMHELEEEWNAIKHKKHLSHRDTTTLVRKIKRVVRGILIALALGTPVVGIYAHMYQQKKLSSLFEAISRVYKSNSLSEQNQNQLQQGGNALSDALQSTAITPPPHPQKAKNKQNNKHDRPGGVQTLLSWVRHAKGYAVLALMMQYLHVQESVQALIKALFGEVKNTAK